MTATFRDEFRWLQAHPEFEQRPASIREFVGPDYLNIESNVRPALMEIMVDIFGEETNPDRIAKYERAMVTGGVGIGKTTLASVVVPYMVHWVLCLKDPQTYFGLMPGSRIAFMQMSTSEAQAKEVVFGDIKARIDASPWFRKNYHYDPKFKSQFHFPKHIWIIPGDSAETTFEGYNCLAGILDEADSHKVTRNKDYAEEGYSTISNRITSRFEEKGFLLVIGQMKKALHVDEPVLTPSGWVPIKDIRGGDQIIGSSGEVTTVGYTQNHGVQKLYRLTTSDGLSSLCSGDHLWTVKNNPKRGKIETHTTEHLMKTLRHSGEKPRYQIQFVGPVQMPEHHMAVPSYSMGAFLGDGSMTGGTAVLSSADFEIVDRVAREVRSLGVTPRRSGEYAYAFTGATSRNHLGQMTASNCLKNALVELGAWGKTSQFKEVPDAYMRGSIQQRLDLLRGLMDTDGSQWKSQNATRFVTTSPKLAEQVCELVRSLGGRAQQNAAFDRTYRNVDGEQRPALRVYTTSIVMDQCPFWVQRKAECWSPSTTNPKTRTIVSIEPEGEGPVKCISVQSEDGLFVTRDFLVTHNSSGFAARKYKDMKADPNAYTSLLTIWESVGWGKHTNPDGTRNSFWYDTQRYSFTTRDLAELQGFPAHILEVPKVYERDFLNSPQKALRDLAGRPPEVNSPLFSDPGKIHIARSAYKARYGDFVPVSDQNAMHPDLRARNSLKRVGHIDIAYSAESGDALGFAIAHVSEIVEYDGEPKPYIVFDLVMQMKAPPGRELFLGDVRQLIYTLKNERKFNIVKISTDGHQGVDMRQQLQRRRIQTELISPDRTSGPYMDLHDAIAEERVAIPPYMVATSLSDRTLMDIVYKELSQLQDEGSKIDHPPDGSKDVSDAIACTVSSIMNDPRFHRRVSRSTPMDDGAGGLSDMNHSRVFGSHPAMTGNLPHAPIPPRVDASPIQWRPPTRRN